MQVGLREANQQFSRLMKAVQGGKEVLLTERGRPLAVVKPICGGETESIFRDSKPLVSASCIQAQNPSTPAYW